ncbi:SEC-C metal-binding domain-containing protein [Oryzobacter faecalis]
MHVSQMLGAMAGAAPAAADTAGDVAVAEEEPVAAGSSGAFGGGADGQRRVEVSGVGVGRPRTGALHYSAPSETGGVDERDEGAPAAGAALSDEQLATTPRNAPCPCGSGKKFKMCHGRR